MSDASTSAALDLDLDEPELLLGAGEGVPEAARLLGVERVDRAGLGIFSLVEVNQAI